jgi:hypothetical protein
MLAMLLVTLQIPTGDDGLVARIENERPESGVKLAGGHLALSGWGQRGVVELHIRRRFLADRDPLITGAEHGVAYQLSFAGHLSVSAPDVPRGAGLM